MDFGIPYTVHISSFDTMRMTATEIPSQRLINFFPLTYVINTLYRVAFTPVKTPHWQNTEDCLSYFACSVE